MTKIAFFKITFELNCIFEKSNANKLSYSKIMTIKFFKNAQNKIAFSLKKME